MPLLADIAEASTSLATAEHPLAVFRGDISEVSRIPHLRTLDEISNEQMLYAASPTFAREHGGPITQEVLAAIQAIDDLTPTDPAYPFAVIDTRVHMLMPRHLPAIPGWHCDNSPRSDYYGQPDPTRASSTQHNYTVLVGTDKHIAPTRFLDQPIQIPYNPELVWRSCHEYIEAHAGHLTTRIADDGAILRFNGQTLHRATPAVTRGWRYFFRLSFMSYPPQDKIRRQVMVYSSDSGGW